MKKGFLHYESYRTTLQGGFMNSKIIIKSHARGLKKNLKNSLKCLCISLVAVLSLASCTTATRGIAQEDYGQKIKINEKIDNNFQSRRLQINSKF